MGGNHIITHLCLRVNAKSSPLLKCRNFATKGERPTSQPYAETLCDRENGLIRHQPCPKPHKWPSGRSFRWRYRRFHYPGLESGILRRSPAWVGNSQRPHHGPNQERKRRRSWPKSQRFDFYAAAAAAAAAARGNLFGREEARGC